MKVGDVLGRYMLRRQIPALRGLEGIAEVFIGDDTTSKRGVAVKVLREKFVAQAEIVALFLGEPRAQRAVEHESTIEVLDIVADAQRPYFVTELVRGTTLVEVLKRGRMPLGRALHVAQQVAQVLAHAHDADVVHRNLKPSNVFLTTRDGDVDSVKLLELGATRMQMSDEKPIPGTVIGTPAYMAPEQLRQIAGGYRVDMYAFGVVLFELALGARPFTGDVNEIIRRQLLEPAPRPRSLSPALPEVLDHLITACLEKDPTKRPPSMHEVALALATLEDSVSSPASAKSTPGPSYVVPKNTSGYTTVTADVPSAPAPVLMAEDDEPSFPSVTDERSARADLPTTEEGGAEPSEASSEPPKKSVPAPVQGPERQVAVASTPPSAPVAAVEQATAPAPIWAVPDAGEIEAMLRPHRPASSVTGPRIAIAAGAIVIVLVVFGLLMRGGGSRDMPEVKAVADAGETPRQPDTPPVPPPPSPSPPSLPPSSGCGDQCTVSFDAEPKPAQVWIKIDNRIRLLCTTPCDFKLPEGKEILVELRRNGWDSVQQTVVVKDGLRVTGELRRR